MKVLPTKEAYDNLHGCCKRTLTKDQGHAKFVSASDQTLKRVQGDRTYICIMQRVAIFASGTGSNAVKVIEHFKGHSDIGVSLVLSNNSKASVLEKASDLGIETYTFRRTSFYKTNAVIDELKSRISTLSFWLVSCG